jgi:hypothetical protein
MKNKFFPIILNKSSGEKSLSNILEAINNIINLDELKIKETFKSENIINQVGDSFEEFITNSFLNFKDDLELKSQVFSWLGNSNNPPDLILKNSDAIEIKKMNNFSTVALNSSFPKDKLYSNDSMITEDCKNIDGGNWSKNFYYAIGILDKNRIKAIFIVDGSLYSAKKEIYQKIKTKIKEGVESIQGTEFSQTKELGRVNKVDPLGITYLRIRGMWGIENPFNVFSYFDEVQKPAKNNSLIYALISKENYQKFPQNSIQKIKKYSKNVKVKNPNNPSQLIKSVLIKVEK